MINISIFLYGKPSWDMPIESEDNIEPRMFKKQGDYLKEHLYCVAEITKKLKSSDWECYGTLYSLEFSKDITKSEAKKELKKLKISLKEVHTKELEEEEC